MGLNDTAWEKLFDKYQILDRVDRDGQFQISASQIKEFREPRLMTKFDHRVNLPAIFRKHNLAILPVTRGDYVISSFSAYQDFEAPEAEVQRISVFYDGSLYLYNATGFDLPGEDGWQFLGNVASVNNLE